MTTSASKGELKPCPFCGHDAMLLMIWAWSEPMQTYNLQGGIAACRYSKCQAFQPILKYAKKNKGSAINAWNTRTPLRGEEENDE